MKKEKIDVPIELDARIMQYAASKKFVSLRWYNTLPARAAAVIFIGVIVGVFQFSVRKDAGKGIQQVAEQVQIDNINWNDFEERMEYVAGEIDKEAVYLAQL